jgi:hypothetical protein
MPRKGRCFDELHTGAYTPLAYSCQLCLRLDQSAVGPGDLQEYLTQRRKEIDRKYDYRYSHLTQVFGRLLHETRVSEEELRGFSEDKLKTIRSFAKFLAGDAA